MELAGADLRAGIAYPPFLVPKIRKRYCNKDRTRCFPPSPFLSPITTMASNLLRFTAVPLTFFAAAASRTSPLVVKPGGALFGASNVRISLTVVAHDEIVVQ